MTNNTIRNLKNELSRYLTKAVTVGLGKELILFK